jgi:TRAP-type mannitol/chloroaromatic compound transport system substrate-binding protein
MDRRSFIRNAGIGGVGAAASTLAAPAVAQSRKTLVMVSTWPRDFPGLGTGAQGIAQRITDESEGAITVEYFAAGERVGAFDAFDEVASGNAQAYHGADYYWKGKHPAFSYFTSVPFGLTDPEMNAWIYHLGGQALWDELSGEFGIKPMMAGASGAQMGGWFNKEMESPEDFTGLKMRIPGIGGDMMAKLGVSVISLPASQIYENLVSGAIDAADWVGPWNDYFLKLFEAAKYYYWPGVAEPSGTLALGFNRQFWDSLTDSERAMITAISQAEHGRIAAEFNANNSVYLDKLVTEHGVELRRFNEEIYDAFREASEEVFDEIVAHSDLAKRVHDSFIEARETVGSWMNIADVGYLMERNRALGLE